MSRDLETLVEATERRESRLWAALTLTCGAVTGFALGGGLDLLAAVIGG